MATDDDGLSIFLSVRARLFGAAYRILGCAAAAEDVVQDAWISRASLTSRKPTPGNSSAARAYTWRTDAGRR